MISPLILFTLMAKRKMATQLKHSVVTTLGKALALILSIAFLISFVSIIMLSTTINDGTSINLVGSLRMQSYRLAYELEVKSPHISEHVNQFENTLLKSAMMLDKNWVLPKSIYVGYTELLASWGNLGGAINQGNKQHYYQELSVFVNQIDAFVYSLERHTQNKLENLAIFSAMGLSIIFLITLFVLCYTKNEIIYPLNRLMEASRRIERKTADIHLEPSEKSNELGELINTFCQMNAQINTFYDELETRITNKTERLTKANQTLDMLYQCGNYLSSQFVVREDFERVLLHLLNVEGISAVHLDVNNQKASRWEIKKNNKYKVETVSWQSLRLETQNTSLGFFRWQGEVKKVDPLLITNIAQMLSRAIYSNQLYKHVLHNAVMEERNSFARELHDSIAQSLSYLSIQNNILNKRLNQEDAKAAKLLSDEIHAQLKITYEQLRELITAFRVTLSHSDFGLALHELRDALQPKTTANICLAIEEINLHPEHQTHLLHIIREACCNAIKHAEAAEIVISCKQTEQMIEIEINDDGKGFNQLSTKESQYGLIIMQERTQALGGKCEIRTSPNHGCQVIIYLNAPNTLNQSLVVNHA